MAHFQGEPSEGAEKALARGWSPRCKAGRLDLVGGAASDGMTGL